MVPSPGVSTFGGALNIRSIQVGFPAKLTSTYDSSTGYTWERLAQVAGTGVVAASLPQTGAYAYAVDGNTALPVDTVVWMEPDANGQGYTFQYTPVPSVISNTKQSIAMVNGHYHITANSSFQDVLDNDVAGAFIQLTLAANFTYLVFADVSATATLTSGAASDLGIHARIYNNTTSTGIIAGRVADPRGVATNVYRGHTFLQAYVTTSGSEVIRLQGYRDPATWTTSTIDFSHLGDGTPTTLLGAAKLF